MKNIKSWIVLTLLLFTISQNGNAKPDDKQGILHPKGLLWKIEKQGKSVSYLYGTMHVGNPDIIKLSPKVERAFMQAEHFVMEVLMNSQTKEFMASASFFNDGRTLKDIMTRLEYKQLRNLLNKRVSISEDVFKYMKPWAVMMLLMTPVDQHAQKVIALDMLLYQRASNRKLELTGLETAQEQVAVFESMGMSNQVWMLNRMIEEIDIADAQFPEMMSAYLDRDLARLMEIQRESMYEDSEIDDQFIYQLLNVRNVRMAKRMIPILKRGNAFIAIGALHLPGEAGVLYLLEQQGYNVTSIY